MLIKVVDWLHNREETYIKAFGANKPPHSLLILANDRVILQEAYYQLATSLSKTLSRGKRDVVLYFL